MRPLHFFIGYDSREPVAWQVFAHSILRRASVPVQFTPLVQSQLRKQGLYTRPRTGIESTEFSMTRFLVPHLLDYGGVGIFADCDMLMLADVAQLLPHVQAMLQEGQAVRVCQHPDYVPAHQTKMDGQVQTTYPRKNWSSFVLFNAAHPACRTLTLEAVNTATGLFLHRFQWCLDSQIGSLPREWNWLIGESGDDQNPAAKNLHYTLGGPWFRDTRTCPRAEVWWEEYRAMTSPLTDAGVAFSQEAWHKFQERMAPAPLTVVS